MRENSFIVLEKHLPPEKNLKILDVGCGTGETILALSKYGQAEGSDFDKHAVNLSRSKGLNVQVGDMHNLNLHPETYDLITFYEVLNQTDRDGLFQVFSGVYSGLKKGGLLMLREPALKIAGGRHDIEVNTKMRFDSKIMREELSKIGFEVLYITYMNFLLFIPIVLKRRLDDWLKKEPESDVVEHSPFVNKLFLFILRIEGFLLRYVKLPFGVTILVIARKPYGEN